MGPTACRLAIGRNITWTCVELASYNIQVQESIRKMNFKIQDRHNQCPQNRRTNPFTERFAGKQGPLCVVCWSRHFARGGRKEGVVMFCNRGWIHLSQPRIFLPQDARNHLPGLVTLQTSSLLCQRHLTDGSTFSFIVSQTRLPYFVKAINPYCSSNISQLLLLKTRSGSQCHVIVQEKYKVVLRRVPLDCLAHKQHAVSLDR
jgi:hypothetical protein